MIGQTISHYPALWDPAPWNKILEKLGEAHLRSSNFGGQGGPTAFRFAGHCQPGLVPRSPISSSEVNQ